MPVSKQQIFIPARDGTPSIFSQLLLGVALTALAVRPADCAELRPKTPKLATPSPAVEALFSPDTLGSNREYIEKIIGPAKYVSGDSYKYRVDECPVEIIYSEGNVLTLKLQDISSKCDFSLDKFFPGRHLGRASTVTFGDILGALGGASLLPACLGTCGNSADPSVNVHYEGARFEQFVELNASNSYPYRGDNATRAFRAIMDATQEKRWADPLYNADCDPRVRTKAALLFADVQIREVSVGANLEANPAGCGRW